MVRAWQDRHFECVAGNNETFVTSVNFAQYAPNFTGLWGLTQIYVFQWFRKYVWFMFVAVETGVYVK